MNADDPGASDRNETKCSCDAFCDEPCPVHARENALQDERIRRDNETLLDRLNACRTMTTTT